MTPTPALAGAWIAPEGGQDIWNAAVAQGGDGLPVYEVGSFYERPINTRTSFVSATWFDTTSDPALAQRGEITLGVKRVLMREQNWVVAAQAGAHWASSSIASCDETGAEVRFLGGYSSERTFLNLELAERAVSGGCGGERVELTAGYRPSENWLAMGQLFFDGPREGGETLKAQITLVGFRESGLGIQIGVRARVDGGEPEPALVLGLWLPPDDDREDD